MYKAQIYLGKKTTAVNIDLYKCSTFPLEWESNSEISGK